VIETLHLLLSVNIVSNVAVTDLRACSEISRFFAELPPHVGSVVTNKGLCIKA